MAPTLPKTTNTTYKLGKKLGSGAFSKVYCITREADKKRFAVKIIEKAKISGSNKEIDDTVKKEIGVMKRLSHPNIVCIKDFLDSPKEIFIVMDLAEGGELFDRIIDKGCYSEMDACTIVKQILEACKYIHGENVVHRDIKPENLLFKSLDEDSDIMLSDFGLAFAAGFGRKEVMTTACGTPGYCAPEILKNRNAYTAKVDCWSVGVVCYILLCGYPPFPFSDDDVVLFRAIRKGDYQFSPPEWDAVSDHAKDFVRKLMNVQDEKRLSAAEALKHDWILKESSRKNLPLVKKNLEQSKAAKTWRKVFNAMTAFPHAKAKEETETEKQKGAKAKETETKKQKGEK